MPKPLPERLQERLSRMTDHVKNLEDALYKVLDTTRLDIAQEYAADALGEDLEDYRNQDMEELDFIDNDYNGDIDYSLLDED